MYLVVRRGAFSALSPAGELAGAAAVACVRRFAADPQWAEAFAAWRPRPGKVCLRARARRRALGSPSVHRPAIRSWLMDMDGVLVHEEQAIPGADRFLGRLKEVGAPFLVLTNNSIYTRRDLAARLRISGLDVPEESI